MYKKCEEILNKLESEGKLKISDYQFPPKQELKLKLKDMLEDEVDEKYYLSEKMIKYISANNEKWTGNNDKSVINKSVASAINTGEGSRRCDASNYISKQFDENFDLKIIREFGIYGDRQGGSVFNTNGLSPTLTTKSSLNWNILIDEGIRIRRLTPKECFKLMGFDDEDVDKASEVNSNTQLYKQAGNSIVVNVLEAILTNLLLEPATNNQEIIEGQTTIFDYIGDSNE